MQHYCTDSILEELKSIGYDCVKVNSRNIKVFTQTQREVQSRVKVLEAIADHYNTTVKTSSKSTIGVVTLGKVTITVKSKDYHTKSKGVELMVVDSITQSVTRGVTKVVLHANNKVKVYSNVCGALLSPKPKSRKHNNGKLVKADVILVQSDGNCVSLSIKDAKGGYHYECADSMYKELMLSVVVDLTAKYKISDIRTENMKNIHIDTVSSIDLLPNVFGSDIVDSGGCVVAGSFEPELEGDTLTLFCDYIIETHSDFTSDNEPCLVIVGNKARNRNHKYIKGLMPVVTLGKRARSAVKLSQIKEEADFYSGVNTTAGMATYAPRMGTVFKRVKLNEYMRIEMPQITDHNLFVDEITKSHTAYYTLLQKEDLEPTQTEFSQEKVDKLKSKFVTDVTSVYSKSIVVALHNDTAYIIDGHHRYYAVMQSDLKYLSCFVIESEPNTLINYLNRQVYTVNKPLNETQGV